MDGYRWPSALLAALLALAAPGCAWLNRPTPSYAPPPVFSGVPTLAEVIQTINANTSRIHSFSTDQATLSGPNFPSLRTSVVFERPRRFRLRAESGLMGPQVDLGSNDEIFWFWVRMSQPKALYYCRHAEFAHSPIQQTLPIQPDWLIEAMGITELNPALPHEGPFPLPDGRLEIRTVINTYGGPMRKVTVVDGRSGLVLEQRMYDSGGQLVASAVAQSHRQDPLTQLVMPRVVDIQCPRAELAMRIDLGNVQVNRAAASNPQLFQLPRYEDYPAVNLCDPNLRFGPPPSGMAARGRPRPPRRR